MNVRTNDDYDWERCDDPYPILREALAPEHAALAPEQIDALFERTFGPAITAEDVEDIFGSIGKFASDVGHAVSHVAQRAAPFVKSALPGVAQGAMAGAALGPVGMLGGAVLGGAGSALAGQKGPAGTMGKVLGSGIGLAGSLAGSGGIVGGLAKGGVGGLGGVARGALGAVAQRGLGALGPTVTGVAPAVATDLIGAPAAGQLLNLLGKPEVMQALQAMLLSPIGRPTVPVAGTPVALAAFTNLLGLLANQAQAQFTASAAPQTATIPEYLVESNGEYRCDPADPTQRAEVLWELLQQSSEQADDEFDTVDGLVLEETYDEFSDEIEFADDEEEFEIIGENL